jgi:enoyl-CoA hydratase
VTIGNGGQSVALVSCDITEGIATVRLDDGKVNALSPEMLGEIGAALDEAAAGAGVVVLTGREGIFSAGFSLPVLQSGGLDAAAMLRGGFSLAERLLSFPLPVIVACPGHAIAMASFLLLSADYRIGIEGAFRITANEVAIGLTMPQAAVEICRQRLAPAHFHRAVILAEVYSPRTAVEAGFLDLVVEAGELEATVREVAARLAKLSPGAHAATKLRARGPALRAIREGVEADFGPAPG